MKCFNEKEKKNYDILKLAFTDEPEICEKCGQLRKTVICVKNIRIPSSSVVLWIISAFFLYTSFTLLFDDRNWGGFGVGSVIALILTGLGALLFQKKNFKNNTYDASTSQTVNQIQNLLDKQISFNFQDEERQKKIEEQKINNPDEYQRKVQLCEIILKEYHDLYKTISKIEDLEEKITILKECYRKLEVIQTTHYYNGCFRTIDEEIKQISKKAISVLNAYIKSEKEDGIDDFTIDILQFAEDLDFISDWIYEKDEKLNKI
jgi:hypothetical protein